MPNYIPKHVLKLLKNAGFCHSDHREESITTKKRAVRDSRTGGPVVPQNDKTLFIPRLKMGKMKKVKQLHYINNSKSHL